MIIYNPHNEKIIRKRLSEAEDILNKIPVKYCFISGSFLHKEEYKDIDVFVISRTKKKLASEDKKIKITVVDFNSLYSLFYHSIAKSCIAKNILPQRPIKVTLADYWQIINETIPTLMNQRKKFHKHIRFFILYTEYLRTGEVLDTVQLAKKIRSLGSCKDVMAYAKEEVPKIMKMHAKRSYAKRFLYTQAGYYKGLREYKSQSFLYELAHAATRSIMRG